MIVQHQWSMSVAAALALLASAAIPLTTFSVPAKAQATDGKGSAGATRGDRPARAKPPTVNRVPPPPSIVSPQQRRVGQNVGRDRDKTPNRVIVRDANRDRARRDDRRRGDGDGRRRGTRYVWGPGFTFYFYDGFYHGDCSWLRQKVRETGSSYWRQRLRQCRDQ